MLGAAARELGLEPRVAPGPRNRVETRIVRIRAGPSSTALRAFCGDFQFHETSLHPGEMIDPID
jgi:hypothetical protein